MHVSGRTEEACVSNLYAGSCPVECRTLLRGDLSLPYLCPLMPARSHTPLQLIPRFHPSQLTQSLLSGAQVPISPDEGKDDYSYYIGAGGVGGLLASFVQHELQGRLER